MIAHLRSRFVTLCAICLLAGCNSEAPAPDTADAAATTPAPHVSGAVPVEATGDVTTLVGEEPLAAPALAEPAATPVAKQTDLPIPQDLSPDDWPQFRGELRDGIVRGKTRLARAWPAEGPRVIWQRTMGQGYSAPSVVGDRIFVNDYDEATNEWKVVCLALETGDELWQYKVAKRIRPNHSITRSAPATDGGFVFSIDPKCELHCLDARDGSLIWKKSLTESYESQIPAWYNGQCPLIDENHLVVATGGRSLIVALDKVTGNPIWESPNPDAQLLSHSSVMPVVIDGVRQYTYLTLNGLVGISAENGEILWSFPWKFNTAVATSPLPLDDGRFLLTAAYHAQT
ncbi:MAG: PQQ-like beta-propeller repeat protein, partial [Planctomycetales bacterium]|nr:PQQ-like beta-propeller repeat protein [Planctomycetales bacterium]